MSPKVIGSLFALTMITAVAAFAYDVYSTGPRFTCVEGNLHMRVSGTSNIYQATNQNCVVATPK